MYRDDSSILSLIIKCFGITNTSVQNFTIRISSIKTVTKCLLKLIIKIKVCFLSFEHPSVLLFLLDIDRCIIFIDVFTPCDSHLSKIFRKSCDIISNPSFCSFT